MAEAHLNSLARFEVYRSLAGLNRSFHLIVQRLQGLEGKNIFDPAKLTELAALAQELQSEINHNMLETRLTGKVNATWARFHFAGWLSLFLGNQFLVSHL
jgi:hypothetical protein